MRALPLLLLIVTPVLADDFDSEDRKWVAECLERLDSDRPAVAEGAVRALGVYGPEAVPAIVSLVPLSGITVQHRGRRCARDARREEGSTPCGL